MPKIIHVIGKGDSGKSSSIRLFLVDRGIYLPTDPRDFKIITPIDKKNTKNKVGVASAGDTAEHVDKNFDFFANPDPKNYPPPYNCDIIVCASKPQKTQSYDAVMKHVRL